MMICIAGVGGQERKGLVCPGIVVSYKTETTSPSRNTYLWCSGKSRFVSSCPLSTTWG